MISTFAKLLQKLRSVFKRTINWNRYQLKGKMHAENSYSHYLADPCF